MGKGKAPQAPQAPDYTALANQQAGLNNQNAFQNWMYSNNNQSNPWGSRGLVADPNSPTGYTLQTSLNPQDQQRLDFQRQVQGGAMGGAGMLLSQMMGGQPAGGWGGFGGGNTNYSNANAPGGNIGQQAANPGIGMMDGTAMGGLDALQAAGGYGQAYTGMANQVPPGASQNPTLGQHFNVAGTYNDIGTDVGTLGDPEGTGQVSQKVNPWTMKGMQNVDFTGLGGPTQNVDAGAMQMGLEDPNSVRDKATQAAYQNWSSTNEPLMDRAAEAERTRIANMGGVSTSQGARNAMGDLADQQNKARMQAMNQATITGGDQAAQNMGMLNTAGQFANQAQGQQFGQGQQNAALYNQGLSQLMQMMTGQAGFNNANVQQGMANELDKMKAAAAAKGALASAQASMHNADVGAQSAQYGQNLAAQTAANDLRLNTLKTMFGMGGVTSPDFANMGGTNFKAPDLYGAAQDQNTAAMQNYNNQMANYNNQQSGTGSMVSSGIMAAATMF